MVSLFQDTWPHLRSHIEQICTDAFLAMFEDNPDVKDKFYDFRDYTVEDLKKPEQQGTERRDSLLLKSHFGDPMPLTGSGDCKWPFRGWLG